MRKVTRAEALEMNNARPLKASVSFGYTYAEVSKGLDVFGYMEVNDWLMVLYFPR